MRIAELAERAGVAASAVRWYESRGVVPSAPRRSNGFRDYSEGDLARLRLVVSLRRLGLAPADAGGLLRDASSRKGGVSILPRCSPDNVMPSANNEPTSTAWRPSCSISR